jgi:hypothetical protein
LQTEQVFVVGGDDSVIEARAFARSWAILRGAGGVPGVASPAPFRRAGG